MANAIVIVKLHDATKKHDLFIDYKLISSSVYVDHWAFRPSARTCSL